MWGGRELHGDQLHVVTRGGAITAARFGQQRISKEQHEDQHAGKARFRGFMGSYGVYFPLFRRPSAYIIHVPALI